MKRVDGRDGCGENSTWAVCQKPLGNTLHGLCDMAGNVWEWVEDDYHDDYTGAPEDGSAWIDTPTRGTFRVYRGGGWYFSYEYMYARRRHRYTPSFKTAMLGFRVARADIAE